MRFLLFIFLNFIIYFESFCQKSVETNFEIQNSTRVIKLAVRLTSKLSNDEEKVHAIHSWITNHIKYDVNKYLRNDYSRVSTQTILRSKKATCVGYSDLFTELCNHSNITSVNVSGYIKDRFTDLGDKIYLD